MRTRSRSCALLAALAWLGPACAPAPPAAKNLVLISIDTLRADRLGAYGHERPTSPNLDAFAARGVLFEDVTSTAPWTLPAHASMLTGLHPVHHGVRTNLQRLPEEVPSLAAILSARGFDTGAFVNAFFMEPRFGLGRGFDVWEVFPEDQSAEGATRRVLAAAERWLEERGERRFLLLVHLFDVHSSYDSAARYEQMFADGAGAESRYTGDTLEIMLGMNGNIPLTAADAAHLARLYDAGIRQLDDQIGDFLEGLDGPDTLVVVTSDHGEEFLEHGSMVHGRTHYAEVLRVPLLLAGAGLPAGVRIDEPASLVDLLPTALDLLGVDAPESDGESLRPLWEGRTGSLGERPLLAETGPMDQDALRSLRRGDWKLIEDWRSGERRLFHLGSDPGEQRDLSAEQPERAGSLARELARLTASPREPDELEPLTEAMKARLRSLGYLGP